MTDTSRSNRMKETLRRAIVIAFLGMFFAGLGLTIFLDEHFYRTSPREPDSRSGHIYPEMIHHGTLVYLTHTEKLPEDYFYILALFLFAAAGLNQRWKCFRQRGDAANI